MGLRPQGSMCQANGDFSFLYGQPFIWLGPSGPRFEYLDPMGARMP